MGPDIENISNSINLNKLKVVGRWVVDGSKNDRTITCLGLVWEWFGSIGAGALGIEIVYKSIKFI